MKHSNHEEAAKNQGASADQNKKTNKAQRHERNDSMDYGSQGMRGNREQGSSQGGDHSNWQKEKQGNKK